MKMFHALIRDGGLPAAGVVPVDITNVARWFLEDNSQYIWRYQDFPCCLPPWDYAWFEYTHSGLINNEGRVQRIGPAHRCGVFTMVTPRSNLHDWPPEKHPGAALIKGFMNNGKDFQNVKPNHKLDYDPEYYVTYKIMYSPLSGSPSSLAGFAYDYLDGDGALGGTGRMLSVNESLLEGIGGDEARNIVDPALFPVQYAISLCHCKNVQVESRLPPRHERRQAERNGEAVIRHKTLVIDGIQREVRKALASDDEPQTARALHICRAHFAKYTEDAPLFGKYTGRFFKPMHVRGSKRHGEVIKDYRIKP